MLWEEGLVRRQSEVTDHSELQVKCQKYHSAKVPESEVEGVVTSAQCSRTRQ